MIKRGSIPEVLLGWMKDQRERYQSGKLSTERIELMEQLPEWIWQPQADLWDLIFNEFSKWARTNNPNSVPKDVFFSGANGRSWTDNQRTRHRTGKLSETQIALLESIPGWTWQRHGARWQDNFLTVKRIIGSGTLSNNELPPNISEWTRTQRRRKTNGTIGQDEIELLETLLGWTWDPPSIAVPRDNASKAISAAWLKNYETLKLYAQSNGTSAISVVVIVEGLKLGKWVSHQRGNYKSRRLDTRKIELLEQLPGWVWSVNI